MTDDRMTAYIDLQNKLSPVISTNNQRKDDYLSMTIQVRNKAITIRVTADERDKLMEKANSYGLTLSGYLRLSGLVGDENILNQHVNDKEGMA